MESQLLICFCYFVCIILVSVCFLLWMSVLHVWSMSLDYILLITARILVPLITLRNFSAELAIEQKTDNWLSDYNVPCFPLTDCGGDMPSCRHLQDRSHPKLYKTSAKRCKTSICQAILLQKCNIIWHLNLLNISRLHMHTKITEIIYS